MKKDLSSAIGLAIVGAVIGYFACNLLLPEPEGISFKELQSGTSYTLTDPNVEVFNYRALNPTVEVYVGDCEMYNDMGECIDDQADEELEELEKDAAEENGSPVEGNENGSSN